MRIGLFDRNGQFFICQGILHDLKILKITGFNVALPVEMGNGGTLRCLDVLMPADFNQRFNNVFKSMHIIVVQYQYPPRGEMFLPPRNWFLPGLFTCHAALLSNLLLKANNNSPRHPSGATPLFAKRGGWGVSWILISSCYSIWTNS